MEDNRELKELLKISAEDNREMKELLKRIVTHTNSVPKIENTWLLSITGLGFF